MRTSHHCYEVSKFSIGVCVWSGILIPAHTTPQLVLLWRTSLTSSLGPPKRSGKKSSFRASSNGAKRGIIHGITHRRNCHSCFSEFDRPAYVIWGKICENNSSHLIPAPKSRLYPPSKSVCPWLLLQPPPAVAPLLYGHIP